MHHPVFHGARAIAPREFLDALRAVTPSSVPLSRGQRHQQRVALAVSGGVDSMALAYLCSQLKRLEPFLTILGKPVSDFVCFVVDHRLRNGSGEEARKVETVLQAKLNLRAEVLTVNWNEFGRAPDTNVETLARRARYRALGKAIVGSKGRAVPLLLAHHEDDVYETVLMRLLAGQGYRGLTGMRAANDIPDCYDLYGVYQSGLMDENTAMQHEVDARAPLLPLLSVEDGGLQIYRPLLGFSKDRLVATCMQNEVPWFEDPTNADATLTKRNALRRVLRNHAIPIALQKPRILALAARCRARVAAEDAEANRFLASTVLTDFEPGAGTVVVQFPTFGLPGVPRRGRSRERRQKRLGHYRLVAALLVRKVLSLVTPQKFLISVGSLDLVVSRLFPSLTTEKKVPKAFTICQVHLAPLSGDRWYLSRAPYSSEVSAPTHIVSKKHISMGLWRPWLLWDGRYWIRVRHRLPTMIRIGPFELQSAKAFREALPREERDRLARLLRRYAPGKVRFTLLALYAQSDVDTLMRGEKCWPESTPETHGQASFPSRLGFEEALMAQGHGRLLALPTLGMQLPGLEHWLRWEVRYRKVDRDVLRLRAPDASLVRRSRRRKQLQAMRGCYRRRGRPGWPIPPSRLPR